MIRLISLILLAIASCTWIAFNVLAEESPSAKKSADAPAKAEPAKEGAKAGDKSKVDFVKDIQPIFKKSCYECHGPNDQEAGLRLDNKKSALSGGDSGEVIISGKSAKSRLIELVAGLDKKTGPMPPEGEGEPLTKEQIQLLKSWIDQGANWPDDAPTEVVESEWKKYWAFMPIVPPSLPSVKRTDWVRNGIDTFILQKLEAEGVVPAAEAERAKLLRRVYLDLIGLPPTPEEVSAFLNDHRPDAYDRVVDQLLASPHYGERWGRHWLDVARYADSDGYEKDTGRPFAWRYRDWVIHVTNDDMPFDIFTIQQLAGDLLTEKDREYTPDAKRATGFFRQTLLNKEGGVDPEEDRVKRTIDRTNTLGVAWLGLSVGCANCHTHKYDPITQKEYFQLYAFMNNLKEVDLSVSPAEKKEQQPDLTPKELLPEDDRDDAANKEGSSKNQAAVAKPAADKKPLSKEEQKAEAAKKRKEKQLEDYKKSERSLYQAVSELNNPRTTFVHLRGDFLSPGAEVEPMTLAVLPELKKRGEKATRLDLARWLMSAEHPLTARVMVNRVWQVHFGRGLYTTVDDFGTKGEKGADREKPSHPELLDWLAAKFRDGGWKMKDLHRLIVTSATYRQSAAARPELADRDPYNSWLARQNRLRVEAEIIRDSALAASGLLNHKIGGPSVRPPQPAGVSDFTYSGQAEWVESQGDDRYRRGLYVWFQRTSPYPSLVVFDAPEATLACTRRERSDTPLQSLTLLNDTAYFECARALGKKVISQLPVSKSEDAAVTDSRIRLAFVRCLGRDPAEKEQKMLKKLYTESRDMYLKDADAAAKFIGENSVHKANAEKAVAKKETDVRQLAETAANITIARVLLNLDEFVTRE